ncbi:MAG: N-acetyl-gamma-glutamyl-phosphate reductase [Clostridiales Family XIII bacterium]|jgi:N-acetyl-gamma-glutamyl-phosphate reductase|nr:N-acetyl-gamma-glutamyl-phosphate reductase [Clostridiales Family XIII bacterium]
MPHKVFIDGREGTTGLKIFERLRRRKDIALIEIEPSLRKNAEARLARMGEADITFLCLPDAASLEIVNLAEKNGGKCRILDTSTAFRTSERWVYGLPELNREQSEKISAADRVSVPGCHATGFILLAKPLIDNGIAPREYPFSCHSLTGYSGGGKKMIAEYEASGRTERLRAPAQYALSQEHKHLPEMQMMSGAETPIVFNPIVAGYFNGMLVTLPLHRRLLKKEASLKDLRLMYREYYENRPMIRVVEEGWESEDGILPANEMAGKDGLEILVYGQDDRIVLAARYDNLGKGASGAAAQCMNIMLGLPENVGLV